MEGDLTGRNGGALAGGEKVIEVAPLNTQERIKAAVALQKSVWGFDDVELLPARLFVTAAKVGGQTLGAFDGQKLVGFCLAIPGVKPGGTVYMYSHMLAVAPEYRNYGIGRRLKLKQRDDALARGITLMEWTFDPLETKNAYFNIERLGAIVRRFTRNVYGTTTSHLHQGLPTHRCTAEWWMDSDRVKAVLSGRRLEHSFVAERISVPGDLTDRKGVQTRVAGEFEEYFDRGLVVTGFENGAYLMEKWG